MKKKMNEERVVGVIKGEFFEKGLRIFAYILIIYGIAGLILVRTGIWNSPPVDTFYYAFAFGLYLDVRVELRKEIGGKKR
jgi:hypothetical protein